MDKKYSDCVSDFVEEISKNKHFIDFINKNKNDKTLKSFLKLADIDKNSLDEKELDNITGGKSLYYENFSASSLKNLSCKI